MVQQNSKGPPAPLEAFGLPNDRRAKFVGCALVYCACFLAFVHFGRLIALAADDFDNWEEFYEPVQDPGCFEVEQYFKNFCDGYEGIHIVHAVFEALVTVTLVVGIIPSVFVTGFLPLLAVSFCNLYILGLCVIAILKLTLPRMNHIMGKTFRGMMNSRGKKTLDVQFGLLIFWLVLDICSYSCLLVLAGMFLCLSSHRMRRR